MRVSQPHVCMGKTRFIARSLSNKERLLNVAKLATTYVDLHWHITFPRGAKQGSLSVDNFLCKVRAPLHKYHVKKVIYVFSLLVNGEKTTGYGYLIGECTIGIWTV